MTGIVHLIADDLVAMENGDDIAEMLVAIERRLEAEWLMDEVAR